MKNTSAKKRLSGQSNMYKQCDKNNIRVMLTIKTLHFHVCTNCKNKSVAHYFGSDLVLKECQGRVLLCMHVLISFCYLL